MNTNIQRVQTRKQVMSDEGMRAVIQQARRKAKLSQFAIADQLNISRATYQRFERGEIWISPPQLRLLADILHISVGVLGLADPQPYVGGEDLLRMWWGLFYAGRSDLLRPQIPTLLHYLQQQNTSTPLLTRGYQIAVTLLRDQGDLQGAQQVANRAVLTAQTLSSIDDQASALRARSRIPIDMLMHTHDSASVNQLVEQAQIDAEAAAASADRLTPILRAIVLMNVADIRARSGASSQEVRQPLTDALSLAVNHSGVDERGYLLTPHGVLHIRARTGWYNSQPIADALADIKNALNLAQQKDGQGRWNLDMQITQAGLYVRAKQFLLAEAIAARIVEAVHDLGAVRLIHRLRGVIEQLDDPRARQTLLAALNRQSK